MKFLPTWDLSNLKNYTPGIWCHWPLGWDFPPTTAPGSVFWGLHTWRASGRFIDLRPRRWASEKPTAVLQGVAVVFFGGGEVLAYKFCKTKKYHMFLLAVSVNLGRFVMLFSVICYRLVSYYPSETLLNERLNQFGPFLSVFRVSMNYMILHGNQVSESTCMKLLFQVCILVHFFDYFRLGYSCLCCQTCGKKTTWNTVRYQYRNCHSRLQSLHHDFFECFSFFISHMEDPLNLPPIIFMVLPLKPPVHDFWGILASHWRMVLWLPGWVFNLRDVGLEAVPFHIGNKV